MMNATLRVHFSGIPRIPSGLIVHGSAPESSLSGIRKLSVSLEQLAAAYERRTSVAPIGFLTTGGNGEMRKKSLYMNPSHYEHPEHIHQAKGRSQVQKRVRCRLSNAIRIADGYIPLHLRSRIIRTLRWHQVCRQRPSRPRPTSSPRCTRMVHDSRR